MRNVIKLNMNIIQDEEIFTRCLQFHSHDNVYKLHAGCSQAGRMKRQKYLVR